MAVVDEVTEADADPEQEQHRVRDADHDRAAPGAAVDRQPVAEGVPGARHVSRSSERPVSFRKTSSSVARRTSAVIGASDISCTVDERRLAVVGVDDDTVRQHLDPLPERGCTEALRNLCLDVGREAQLEDLARHVRLDQLARRALGHDPAGVHHREPVAELLCLVHVVGRDDQRDAVALEAVEPVPEHVPRLRVEAGRGLVEQQDLGLIDQRARDREPAAHAAGERLDLGVRLVLELREGEQAGDAIADDVLRKPEVAAVDEEVLANGQLAVEAVVLRNDADPRPDLGPIAAPDPCRARGACRR